MSYENSEDYINVDRRAYSISMLGMVDMIIMYKYSGKLSWII